MSKVVNKDELVILKFNDREIIAIPSKHYDLSYAALVNAICSDIKLRPDAIAVELNESIVSEIKLWLTELGVGPEKKSELPVMLAIAQKNTLLHPVKKEAVNELQSYYKTCFNNIDKQIVAKVLDIPDKIVVPISATDSIIEGIRCAMETEVPVFGIDTIHSTQMKEGLLILEDFEPGNSFKDFINKNKSLVDKLRDDYSDIRREIAMASRLKSLISKYNRVLFICGMAHWTSIEEKLNDTSILPAEMLADNIEIEAERAILHPVLTVNSFHKYPIISTIYENNRPHSGKNKAKIISPNYEQIFRQIFNSAKENYENDSINKPITIDQLKAFEQMLANMNLLNLCSVPSMADILRISNSVFPKQFQKALIEAFMNIGREWATSEQFGVPVIKPEYKSESASDDFTIQIQSYNESDENQKTSRNIYTKGGFGQTSLWKEYRNYGEEKKLENTLHKIGHSAWIWPPNESLLHACSFRAIELAEIVQHTTEFNGSMENGIDFKKTIKSYIKNENKVFVKKTKRQRNLKNDDFQQIPVVFIFTNQAVPDGYHTLYISGYSIGEHIKNKQKYIEFINRNGSYHIANVSYYLARDRNKKYETLAGTILFNPCLNAVQAARYLEEHNFNCMPALRDSSIKTLKSKYQEKFGIAITENDWKSNLILYGIPFAKEKIVVVVPDGYQVPNYVVSEARKWRIDIKMVPLNYFPSDRIVEVRKRTCVYSTDKHGLFYPAEAEELMQMSQTKYFDLLPSKIRKQMDQIFLEFQHLKNPTI